MAPVEWFIVFMVLVVVAALIRVETEVEEEAERQAETSGTSRSIWDRMTNHRTWFGRALWLLAVYACLSLTIDASATLIGGWATLDVSERLRLATRVSIQTLFFCWVILRLGERAITGLIVITTILAAWTELSD